MSDIITEVNETIYIRELFDAQRVSFFNHNKNISITERVQKLTKIKDWILTNENEILKALELDLGKNEVEARLTDIKPVLWEIELASKKLKQWVKPKKTKFNISFIGTSSKTIYEPLGQVLILAPWNFPFNLSIGPLVSAIAAGNNVILKPSEFSTSTSLLIKKLTEELFKKDEICTILGGASIAEELIKLPFNHIFFTGSPAIGKVVMRAAAENLSSVTLELGGCNPAIVDKTTDINDAVQKIIFGKFLNAGQSCLSINYLFVHQSLKDQFISTFIQKLNLMFPLNANGQREGLGKIINNKHLNRIKKIYENTIDNGAKNLLNENPKIEENYFPPALLIDTTLDSLIMNEEIFGPLLPIIPYENLENVISIIQKKPSPLAIYVFTKSKITYERIVNETVSGTSCLNETSIQFVHPNLPFGGINNSGIGKSHGHYGFLAFSNQRALLIQRIGFTIPKLIYPPYTKNVKKISKLLMKYF